MKTAHRFPALFFLTSLFLFVLFDFVWLGFVVRDFNFAQLSEIGRTENGVFSMSYPPAIAAYLFMAGAATFFVRPLVVAEKSLIKSFAVGAGMGLIVYGIYDTTNLAVLRNYPLAFAFADMAWGTLVFGLVTVASKRVTA